MRCCPFESGFCGIWKQLARKRPVWRGQGNVRMGRQYGESWFHELRVWHDMWEAPGCGVCIAFPEHGSSLTVEATFIQHWQCGNGRERRAVECCTNKRWLLLVWFSLFYEGLAVGDVNCKITIYDMVPSVPNPCNCSWKLKRRRQLAGTGMKCAICVNSCSCLYLRYIKLRMLSCKSKLLFLYFVQYF